MKIIGLTGGIGSGKSTVAQILSKLGAVILEADKLGHEVLQSTEAKREIVSAFGEGVLAADGTIDRKKLSAKVFGNPGALNTLNNIVHPRMYQKTVSKFDEYRRSGTEVVVLDAPLLIEAGITSLVDEIWVTYAPEATMLERIRKRSGLSSEETLARIRAQLTQDKRREYADIIIDTDCSLEELEQKVKIIWDDLSKRNK
jgi:dephospho-CoA kinase